MPLRVAVIGARRRTQGIGAHLARFCAQAGHDVVAVLGTSPTTAAEAAALLFASTGQRARAHVLAETLFEDARPDALVVASPPEDHGRWLDLALRQGVHVLCEKPLLWGGPDPVHEATGYARRFLARGLHLRVNAQWPYTLATYRALFPTHGATSPRTFWMRLSPRSTGPRMLLDAMPHALSLLACVAPDPAARLGDVVVECASEQAVRVRATFVYETAHARIESEVALERCVDPPRPAGYGFDGNLAERTVELDGYRMSLAGGGRQIPLPDPTPLLVGSFLDDVARGRPPAVDPAAVPGMAHLARLLAAVPVHRSPAQP